MPDPSVITSHQRRVLDRRVQARRTAARRHAGHPRSVAATHHCRVGCRARSAARGRSIILVAESETQDRGWSSPSTLAATVWTRCGTTTSITVPLSAITGKREAYYSDHHGTPQELISAAKRGYLFQGQRYAWQKQPRGTSHRWPSGRCVCQLSREPRSDRQLRRWLAAFAFKRRRAATER